MASACETTTSLTHLHVRTPLFTPLQTAVAVATISFWLAVHLNVGWLRLHLLTAVQQLKAFQIVLLASFVETMYSCGESKGCKPATLTSALRKAELGFKGQQSDHFNSSYI